MRMTRAALRAQASEEVVPSSTDINNDDTDSLEELKKQVIFADNTVDPFIHEDSMSDKENSSVHTTDDKISDVGHQETTRMVLRDITEENYPMATTNVIQEEATTQKKKKAKSVRGKKKKMEVEVQVHEGTEVEDRIVDTNARVGSAVEMCVENASSDISQGTEDLSTSHVNEQVDSPAQLPLILSAEQTSDHKSMVSSNTADSEHLVEAHEQSNTSVQSSKEHPTHDMPCPASSTPQKSFEHLSKTPKFDPSVHLPVESQASGNVSECEDSFVDSIKMRSPSKLGQHDMSNSTSDSFIDHIITRTPSKSVTSPRVEDSVEALDALEDAIEKFSEGMSAINSLPIDSPIKSRKTPAKTPAKASSITVTKTPAKTTTITITKTPSKTPAKTTSPMSLRSASSRTPQTSSTKTVPKSMVKERVKALESKPVPAPNRRATSISLSKAVPAQTNQLKSKHTSLKSVSAFSSSPSLAEPTTREEPNIKKRVASGGLSTSKPAFVPSKSSKPPTKSSFILPGEAIAAKLKAQREERQKREESVAEKKQFKARPVPMKVTKPVTAPRENKTSQARMSAIVKTSDENKENTAPVRSSVRPIASGITVTKPRLDTAKANSSARRTTTLAASSTIRKPVAPASNRITSNGSTTNASLATSNASMMVTKSTQHRGKEVYGRHRNAMEAEAKEKKEKEEAAKKARAEAAEKGRQASREWAEKMKKRMSVVEKKVDTTMKIDSIAN